MQLKPSIIKPAGAAVVITALLLAELDTEQVERTATTQTPSVPQAISGGSKQQEATICQGARQESGGDGWKQGVYCLSVEIIPLFGH